MYTVHLHFPPIPCTVTIYNIRVRHNIEFNIITKNGKQTPYFKTAHLNVRSLRHKLDEVRLLLQNLNIDILCVSETRLDQTICDSHVARHGYQITRCDHTYNGYGGVAIYVRDTITFQVRHDINTSEELEMMWIEIPARPNKDVLIACIYRPPSAPASYYNHIVDTLERASSFDKFMIVGDTNYNYEFNEDLYHNPIFMLENMFMLKQLILSPTRVTMTSSSLLDIILSSNPDEHTESGVYKIMLSDHYLIYTCIKTHVKKNKHKEIRFRDYSKFDICSCIDAFKNGFTS